MNVKQILMRLRYIASFAIVFLSMVATLYAQSLNFDFKDTQLKVVLKKVTEQTGYDFVYSDALKVIDQKVNAASKNETPEQFFSRYFPTINVTYKIQGKQVVLSPKEGASKEAVAPTGSNQSNQGQEKFQIKGKVTETSGLPLPGVSIQNLTDKTGAYSDYEGNYTLNVRPGDRILFSYIGFKKREQLVSGMFNARNNVLNISLDEDAIALESVAVIGYGNTQKIKDVTGSIAHMGKKELETAPMGSTVQSMLQGRAAGVNVQIQSASPTSPISVIIRGQSSLSGDNQPLWVIDGIPEYNSGVSGSISNVLYSLNLNDVESIDILKDASSTAIYGSRAANGVIVVTTKSGKEGMKPTLELSSRWGYQVMNFNGYDYFKGADYLNFTKKATRHELYNRGTFDYFTRLYLSEAEFWKLNTSEVDIRKIVELPGAYYDSDTYWMGEMTRNPLQQQYDLTLKGGTKEVSYLAGLNYTGMQGVVKTGFSKNYGGKIRLEARINKDLKMRLNANGSTRSASDKDYMLDVLKKVRPDIPVYNADGSLFTRDAYTENPYTTLKNTGYGTGENITASAELEWTILKGLIFTTRGSVNYSNTESLSYKRRGSTFNYDGSRSWSRTKSDTKIFDNTLVYANTFGKHDISASLTASVERFQTLKYGMAASNFPDDDVLNSFSNAATKGSLTEAYEMSSMVSQIARAQYKYDDRYLATFTIRHDGSSKFGPDRRWGWFPSGGLGWIISNEDFMKSGWLGDYLTHMKLRASYGKSGSQNLQNYQWMTMVGSVNYMEQPGIYPSNIGNLALQWEETLMTDIALEMEFWQSRIRTTLGYYNKKSDNLLYSQTLAPSSAFSSMMANIASTDANGIEFSVDVDVLKSAKWQLTLNANGSSNRSKVLRFNNTMTELTSTNYYTKIIVGEPIGQWFGLPTYKRLFGTSEEAVALKTRTSTGGITMYRNNLERAGDIYYRDTDGNGTINNDDRIFLGTALPKLFGGFGLQLYIGNSFNIGATFTYAYGNKRLWDIARTDVGYTGNYNQSNKIAGMSAILKSPFEKTTLPNATPYGDGGNGTFSDYWLYDASFIRLNALNMSYRLDKHYFRNTLIDNIEITFQASNLFTLTKYPGFDPQGNFSTSTGMASTSVGVDYSYYPDAKTFNLGFKFTFK